MNPILSTALAEHRAQLMVCEACPNLGPCVPPIGPSDPLLFIIGQSPGREEVDAGMPFVGRAGGLLNELLVAAGIPRDRCFITNTVKCWPTNNRPSEADAIANCRKYLVAELKLLQPKALLCLGRDALRVFGALIPFHHGLRIMEGATKVLVSYHPAYYLRQSGMLHQFLGLADSLSEMVYGTVRPTSDRREPEEERPEGS